MHRKDCAQIVLKRCNFVLNSTVKSHNQSVPIIYKFLNTSLIVAFNLIAVAGPAFGNHFFGHLSFSQLFRIRNTIF